jgi:serine/threonine-protein kinase
MRLDPLSPFVQVCLAVRLAEDGQFEQALDRLQATAAAHPGFGTVHLHLGRTCWLLRRDEEALAHLRRGPAEFPLTLGLTVAVLTRLGRREEALAVLNELEQLSSRRYVGAFPFAVAWQGLGDEDAALAWFTKAFDAHEGILIEAVADPVTSVLCTDPRFAALVERLNLPRRGTRPRD